MSTSKTKTETGESLLGRYFHTRGEDHEVGYQGRIIGRPEPGWYVVEHYKWGMGQSPGLYLQ